MSGRNPRAWQCLNCGAGGMAGYCEELGAVECDDCVDGLVAWVHHDDASLEAAGFSLHRPRAKKSRKGKRGRLKLA